MRTKQEVLDIVQAQIDETFEDIDLGNYICACDELTDEERKWAAGNLGAEIHLSILK